MTSKYHKWYHQIVEHRKANIAEGYTEKHHIILRSLGGTDDPNNLVILTAREHFICHRLLTKMITGSDRIKMLRALNAFSIGSKKNPRRLTSKQYAIARAAYVPRTDYVHSIETRSKISKALRGKIEPEERNAKRSATLKGRTLSEEHRINLSKSLKGRVSPTKGRTFSGRSFSKLSCPVCGKEIGKNNFPQHLNRHDAYKS